MSLRRLVLTAVGMGLVALVLAALTPDATAIAEALGAPQRTVDTAGPDALVVAAAGALAWLVWAWGCLGLALTAASALPGLLGAAARLATHVVLPAGARRSAAVLLGLGLTVAGPLGGVALTVGASPAAAAVDGVPDWPGPAPTTAPTAPAPPTPTPTPTPTPQPATPTAGTVVPDWPADVVPGYAADAHVVVRGDSLWCIAERGLLAESGSRPTPADVARAVQSWWTANADVIGPDPDRLLPGQVLHPPAPA